MSTEEVTQDQLNELTDDATYLQDEAEALRYVIDTVPYDQAVPERTSILEKLLFLDHIQVNYYRPLFEKVGKRSSEFLKASDFETFSRSFKMDPEEEYNVLRVLGKLAKHRAALINIFRNIPLIDWEIRLHKDNKEITLYNLATEMIRKDREILKEIADLVMIFQQDNHSQRELKKKTLQKENPQENPQSDL